MELFTHSIREQLLRNGRVRAQFEIQAEAEPDFIPVVKLFTPDAGSTWLLTELDPECPDIAFGLCDLGMGFPELGTVSVTELDELRGRLGLPVERDLHFAPSFTLSVYAHAAGTARHITGDREALERCASELHAARQAAGGAS